MSNLISRSQNITPERWSRIAPDVRAALLRSDLYRALSWSFLSPDPAIPSNVVSTSEHARERARDLPTHAKALVEMDKLCQFRHSSIRQLELEFNGIFGHTISAECPPYETQYGTGLIFAQAQQLGDIAAFYRAFGMQVSPDAHERVDHISAELEFMSVLALREAVAGVEGQTDRIEELRETERKFLVEHLAAWAVSFAERLERKARNLLPPDGGFHGALARCLEQLLRDELQFHQIDDSRVTPLQPACMDFEPEGCNFACGSADEPVLVSLPGFES